MKKFFRTVMAFCLAGGMLAFTGCTDYEDDINKLNERIDALETGKIADVESQLSTLQNAINTAQTAIDALEGLGLDELKTTVEDLKLTIDGINLDDYATKSYADATFATKDAVSALEKSLGALETRLNTIEGKYDSDLKISEIIAQVEDAQDDASSALGQIEALQEALGAYATAGALEDALGDKLNIEDFDAKFEEALKAALQNDGEVTGEIAQAIKDAVSEFNALFASRLTSISLIPTAYLEGVPAIKFNSYVYKPKTVTADEKITAGDDFRIAAKATDVKYHISPSYITKEDVQTPSYLIQKAELLTKSAEDVDLSVVDYTVEKDVLTVSVRRDAGVSLNLDGNYIYTAALKVPIAEKHLVEGETEANVYSEYSALYEDDLTPYIAAVIDDYRHQTEYECPTTYEKPNHFYGAYDDVAVTSSAVAKESAYNEPIDLLSMVTGCTAAPDDDKDLHEEISKTTLKENGLAFRFAVPTKAFEVGDNGTDQQKFAVVEQDVEAGTALLKSTYPGAQEGEEPNQASIYKTPVVRVELVDTVNNKIVDVRYFKVQWTPVPDVPKDVEDLGVIETFEYTLGCEGFEDSINWATFVEKILSKINDGDGLAYADFVDAYSSADVKYEVDYVVDTDHTPYTIKWDGEDYEDYDERAAAITWEVKTSEFAYLIDGENVADLTKGDVIKTFTINFTLPSKYSYNGNIKFALEVDVLVPELPSLVGLNTADWITDGELARIRPVQYRSQGAQKYVTYNYDLTTLFRTNADGYLMDNVAPVVNKDFDCRAWSMQFAADQMNDYIPGFNTSRSMFMYASEDATAGAGYQLWDNHPGTVAVNMTYAEESDVAVENWHSGHAHGDIALTLTGTQWTELGGDHYKGTDAAIALLENIDTPVDEFENRITINAWGRINPWNHVIVKTFDVVFIKPVYVNQSDEEQFFEDGYEGGREVNLADLFTAEDSWGYPVSVYTATGTTDEVTLANGRKVYYDVQNPTFDLKNARISMTLENDNYVPMDNAGSLTDADVVKLPKLSEFDQNASVAGLDKNSDGVDDVLVFTSERGWNLEKVVYIYVEVTIEHKWGAESLWVHIPVYPHGQTPAGN